jgi:hypothetical protein
MQLELAKLADRGICPYCSIVHVRITECDKLEQSTRRRSDTDTIFLYLTARM